MKKHAEMLQAIYTPGEANILMRRLTCHATGLSVEQILAMDTIPYTKEQSAWIDSAVERLLMNEPIQHIIGSEYFHGSTFKCDRRALIPRPETEELVDWIIEDHKGKSAGPVLDIGTGTGCIAISLALALKDAQVEAMDISLDAISIAKENAEALNADISFIHGNILKAAIPKGRYSVIVSNPPYVRECEKAAMDRNVLDYDPSIALFVTDDDPLIFYRAIAKYAMSALKPEGLLYLEINQYLPDATCELLKSAGLRDIQLRNDINGNPRMIRARRA